MSKTGTPEWIVEWSPLRLKAYDPVGRTQLSGDDFASLPLGTGRSVLLALSRRSTFVKSVRVPNVPRDQMLQLLRVSAGNHLPLPPNEVAFDVHITPDTNLEGRLISLVAVRTEELKTAVASVKAAGHKVLRTVPVAWGSVFIAERLGLSDAVVVQPTDEGWAIDLVHAGGLRYSRLVPTDTQDLEEEVARTCAASGIPCADIVAAGGARIDWANKSYDLSSLQALADHPEALDMDLEPQEDVVARSKRDKQAQTRSAGLIATLAVLLLGGIFYDQSANAKKDADLQKAFQERQAPILKQKADLESRASTLLAAQKDLDVAYKPGQHLSDALMAASNDIPPSVWLTGASAERGKLMQLRGTALSNNDVTAYVKALASDGRFREVRLVFANQGQINQTPIVQFSISAVIIANLPLPTATTAATGVKK